MTAKNKLLPLAAATGEPTPDPTTAPPWMRPIVEEILRENGVHSAGKKDLPPGFLDFKALCARVPLGERTIRTLIKRKILPHIRVKGGRRLLFYWPNVESSLRRFEQGGIEL